MGDDIMPATGTVQPINEASLERCIRKRTDCECICELAYELRDLDSNIQKLKGAIELNPANIRAEAKALRLAQLIAMNDYKKALFARIRDLIDHDI